MGSSRSKPEPPPSPKTLPEAWRKIPWGNKEKDLQFVRDYQPHNQELPQLRILLHGPVGSGKSSFINTVDSLLQGRMAGQALADAMSGDSFSVEFNPVQQITEDHQDYNQDPTLKDKVHVLVCVISAATTEILHQPFFDKMRKVRLAARDRGIPQIAILTKIDEACPEVKKDITNVYKSKYIKKQMEKIRADLGIPLYCIFPVRNYHEEIDTDDHVDALIASALKHIITFGEDFVNGQSAHMLQ